MYIEKLTIIKKLVNKNKLQEAVEGMFKLAEQSGEDSAISCCYDHFNNGCTLKLMTKDNNYKIDDCGDIKNIEDLKDNKYYIWGSDDEEIGLFNLEKETINIALESLYWCLS